jgi:hypothetical protein
MALNYLWGGERPADAAPESESPELAMREAMELHGNFAKKADGTLEFDDFLLFRAIITRQAGRMFAPIKAELDSRKLAAFNSKS